MVTAATISAEAPCPYVRWPLADLLTHRHDDALPADHRPQTQRDGDRDFHPDRNEFRRRVLLALR